MWVVVLLRMLFSRFLSLRSLRKVVVFVEFFWLLLFLVMFFLLSFVVRRMWLLLMFWFNVFVGRISSSFWMMFLLRKLSRNYVVMMKFFRIIVVVLDFFVEGWICLFCVLDRYFCFEMVMLFFLCLWKVWFVMIVC